MNDFVSNNRSEEQHQENESIKNGFVLDEDLVMEQILDNLNNTPLGQVLKNIASLPEVSREKVLGVRRQLTDGKYDVNRRLDVVVDRVLPHEVHGKLLASK